MQISDLGPFLKVNKEKTGIELGIETYRSLVFLDVSGGSSRQTPGVLIPSLYFCYFRSTSSFFLLCFVRRRSRFPTSYFGSVHWNWRPFARRVTAAAFSYAQHDVVSSTACVCVWPNCREPGPAVSCVYFLVISGARRGKAVPALCTTELAVDPDLFLCERRRGEGKQTHAPFFAVIIKTGKQG